MKKIQMIEFITEHIDWHNTMNMGLGHHSWWHTNRKSDDCINVKIHSYVDVDNIELTEQQKKIIKTTGFDLNEWLNSYIWDENGIIDTAREQLEYNLQEKFNVSELEYGGRSGGWLAVVYNWDDIPEDFDEPEYTYQEVREYYNQIKKAIKENEKVIEFVEEAKRSLEKWIETPSNYSDELDYILSELLEIKTEEAKAILAIK